MRPKPTRDEVDQLLTDFEAHELIGSRRDVYELVVNVFKDWLAQEKELEENYKHIFSMGQQIARLEAENQVLEHKCKMLCCRVGVLEMENKALKAKLLQLEA